MHMTPAGKRDRLISFVRPVVTRDVSGAESESDAGGEPDHIANAWAAVRFGTSQERRQAGAEGASQSATFRTLSNVALRSVVTTDRILGEGLTWDIVGIAAVGGPACEIEFTAVAAKE